MNQTLHREGVVVINKNNPKRLSWATWIIARLAGWKRQNRRRPPGPITLKTGLDKFNAIFHGWKLALNDSRTIWPDVKVNKVNNSFGTNKVFLFCSQAIHRVGNGCFNCLETDGEHWNDDDKYTCRNKYCPTNIYPVNIILQPPVHQVPCNRGCNNKRDKNQP